LTYRPVSEEEKPAVLAVLSLGFGIPGEAEGWAERMPTDQLRVIEDGGQFAGVLRVSTMPQFWLGQPVASAQVLALATSLEQRGRGHGQALLKGLFEELREAGIPTVTLQPSTARFYRGAGFEFAGAWNLYEVSCEQVPPLDPAYRVRRLDADDLAPIIGLYERVAPSRHGAFFRDDRWWRQRLGRTRPPETQPTTNLLVESSDGPVGWLMLAFGTDTDHRNSPTSIHVRIQDWGCLPGHDLALLGVLAGYRSMEGMVSWSGPDPDPLLFLLPNESLRLYRRRHWMLRLVDLAGAFGARPYPREAEGRVVLRVEDATCPWNTGTWALEVAGGQGKLARVSDHGAGDSTGADATGGSATSGGAAAEGSGASGSRSPAIATVRGLAALFTGFAGPDKLANTGLLQGMEAGDLALLRAAFAGPAPFTAELY
jgi:predicted acetyltransferase